MASNKVTRDHHRWTRDITAPQDTTIDVEGDLIVDVSGGQFTIQDTTTGDPDLTILSNADNEYGPYIYFKVDRGGDGGTEGEDDDRLGILAWLGFNDAGTPEQKAFAEITASILDATDQSEAGKLELSVLTKGSGGTGSEGDAGLVLSGSDTNDEVDVTIGNGTSSLTTVAGDLTLGGTKIILGNGMEIDNSAAANVVIFKENVFMFKSPTGLMNFSLVSYDGDDNGDDWTIAAESDKSLSFYNDISGGNVKKWNLTTAGDMKIESATTETPTFTIKNTTNDQTGSHIKFLKDKGAAGAAGDVLGSIDFYGDDAGQVETQFASIHAEVDVATNGEESGELVLKVASDDGGLEQGLKLTGGSVDTEVDVVIGNGTASVTTIAGDLTVTGNNIIMPGNGMIEPVGHLSLDIGASKEIFLLENGGTYTPSAANHAVPKHYLDANTYHFIKCGFSNTGTDKNYLPIAGTENLREDTNPTGESEKVLFICPYNGSVEKVLARSTSVCDSSVLGIHIASNGTEMPSATATQSVTVDMAVDDTSYEFDFAGAGTNTFTKGQVIMFSFDPTSAMNDMSFTIVLKFDVST